MNSSNSWWLTVEAGTVSNSKCLWGVILQALGFEIVHLKAKVAFDYELISGRLRREFKGGLTEKEVRE
jgi:hypothetical protein